MAVRDRVHATKFGTMQPSFVSTATRLTRFTSRPSICVSRRIRVYTTMSSSPITPAEAQARKSDGWVHLDVRTPEEFSNLRAPSSVNVPFMFRGDSGMTLNENFVSDVASAVKKEDRLVVSCASGKRSARASTVLVEEGYTVADVGGGMAAWTETAGLPTEGAAAS